MKKLLFGLVILFSCLATVSAQSVEAIKIEEFGTVSCDDLVSRLDSYFTQIMNNLKTAKAYIVIYEGKLLMPLYNQDNRTINPRRGEVKVRIQTIKNQMKFRTIPEQAITFIEGGFRNNFTFELWLVPNSVMPPKASPTLEKIKYRKGKATDICEGL